MHFVKKEHLLVTQTFQTV